MEEKKPESWFVPEILRRTRLSKFYDIKDFAKAINVEPYYIAFIEAGLIKPLPELLDRMEAELKVEKGYFYYTENTTKNISADGIVFTFEDYQVIIKNGSIDIRFYDTDDESIEIEKRKSYTYPIFDFGGYLILDVLLFKNKVPRREIPYYKLRIGRKDCFGDSVTWEISVSTNDSINYYGAQSWFDQILTIHGIDNNQTYQDIHKKTEKAKHRYKRYKIIDNILDPKTYFERRYNRWKHQRWYKKWSKDILGGWTP